MKKNKKKNIYLMIALSLVLIGGYFLETNYFSKNKINFDDKSICINNSEKEKIDSSNFDEDKEIK